MLPPSSSKPYLMLLRARGKTPRILDLSLVSEEETKHGHLALGDTECKLYVSSLRRAVRGILSSAE